jgi:ABC-type phosphate/phosphonate transport system ATPase subunit
VKITLTPKMAEEFLENRLENYRKSISHSLIAEMVDDIRKNRWEYNGESIKMDKNGQMCDGEHRCRAVVIAQKPIVIELVKDVDNWMEIDRGRPRSTNDTLRYMGEKNVAMLGGSLKWIYIYKNYAERCDTIAEASRVRRGYKDITRMLKQCPGVRDAVTVATTIKTIRMCRTSWYASLIYMTRRSRRQQAAEFNEGVRTGEDLTKHDPRMAYRRYLLNQLQKPHNSRLGPTNHLACGIKAWNAFYTDREIQHLAWRQMGIQAEEFPLINGFKEVNAE